MRTVSSRSYIASALDKKQLQDEQAQGQGCSFSTNAKLPHPGSRWYHVHRELLATKSKSLSIPNACSARKAGVEWLQDSKRPLSDFRGLFQTFGCGLTRLFSFSQHSTLLLYLRVRQSRRGNEDARASNALDFTSHHVFTCHYTRVEEQ